MVSFRSFSIILAQWKQYVLHQVAIPMQIHQTLTSEKLIVSYAVHKMLLLIVVC